MGLADAVGVWGSLPPLWYPRRHPAIEVDQAVLRGVVVNSVLALRALAEVLGIKAAGVARSVGAEIHEAVRESLIVEAVVAGVGPGVVLL